MKFLPEAKMQLVVNEPLLQVRERLISNVGPRKSLMSFSSAEEHYFSGKIENSSFTIYRNINTRSTAGLIFYGCLEPHLSGTQISIKIRLNQSVVVFLIIWIGMAINFIPFIAEASVALGAALSITYASYWYEANWFKATFLEIFKKTIVNTPPEPSR